MSLTFIVKINLSESLCFCHLNNGQFKRCFTRYLGPLFIINVIIIVIIIIYIAHYQIEKLYNVSGTTLPLCADMS